MNILIRPVREDDFEAWFAMRAALWPPVTMDGERADMEDYLRSDDKAVFVAQWDKKLVGFVEANIRHYAEDCETQNVGYLEAWYVDENFRREGVGASLVRAAEEWAREKGCREMASDCLLENSVSLAAHEASTQYPHRLNLER